LVRLRARLQTVTKRKISFLCKKVDTDFSVTKRFV